LGEVDDSALAVVVGIAQFRHCDSGMPAFWFGLDQLEQPDELIFN
jgi:hypothetical protein